MIEECQACGFETKLTEYESCNPRRPDPKRLCDLCASTLTGNVVDNPEHHLGEGNVLRTICHVGNVILAELRKDKRSKRRRR